MNTTILGGSLHPQQAATVEGPTTVMFPKSGSPRGFIYFCPFAKTLKPIVVGRDFDLLGFFHSQDAHCSGPSRKRPPAWPAAAASAARGGPSADPSRPGKGNVGVFSASSSLSSPTSRRPGPRPRDPRTRPPAASPAAPLTLRQLHSASAAQRARQAVELLHRSLHPRRAPRAPRAAPAASALSALHPAAARPAAGDAGSPPPRPGRHGPLEPASSARVSGAAEPITEGTPAPPRLAPFLPPPPLPSWTRAAFWEL